MSPESGPALGLRANARQFWLLVLVNAFVGAMVGLERAVVPLLAETEFALASHAAALSFIATFGLVKALSNLAAGRLADRIGRRPVLVAGWIAGLPVPLLVIAAPSWSWVVAANVLLGVNQGLAWSTTVLMKIDLVGPRQRGLAMGLNEFAGYIAVGVAAFATGVLAERFGLRPAPFYLGLGLAIAGLALSLLLVRETSGHARLEALAAPAGPDAAPGATWRAARPRRGRVLAQCSQAGLVNNLNDGVAWGLLPPLFASAGLTVGRVGLLAAVYPVVWGALQLVTGPLSDRIGRRPLIVWGMTVQGFALLAAARVTGLAAWSAALVALGVGTAMAYPALLAAVGDAAPPARRGAEVGAYRSFRDGGYVVGAIGGGWLADAASLPIAVGAAGAVTLLSGALVALRMPEPMWREDPPPDPRAG